MTRDELKAIVVATMLKVAAQQEIALASDLGEDTVLLDSGLDSLGFAILVASLEMDYGFDPFAEVDDAYYPRTLRDFVDFYHQNWPA